MSKQPQVGAKKTGSLKGISVLVVEDYPFMVDMLTAMLREFGVGRIIVAENGEEAKDLIRYSFSASGNAIDMVLVDWLMPVCNGVELLQWVRGNKNEQIRFLPMVLISANTSERVVKTSRDFGANEALVKPVSPKSLSSHLAHVINHPRPFVKAPGFFGPDRRRQFREINFNDRRKTAPELVKEYHEQL
ncbi:MAG: response regulator [Alphaproteobacteria bacterium]|nr:response regulator [Alphaproteobacteria bacterium]